MEMDRLIWLLLFRHTWVLFVLVTCLQALALRRRADRHLRAQPELAEECRALSRGWMIFGNVPWIVMGLGLTVGGVPTVWHYFRPRDGHPSVIAFFVTVIFLWVLGFHWIFLRGGADILSRHPAALNLPSSPTAIKFLYVLCVVGGAVAVGSMFQTNTPVPTWRPK